MVIERLFYIRRKCLLSIFLFIWIKVVNLDVLCVKLEYTIYLKYNFIV